jgi:hypothetical protein
MELRNEAPSPQGPEVEGSNVMNDSEVRRIRIPWPHAPLHQLSEAGTFFVTAGTYQKQHHFRGPQRLTYQKSYLARLRYTHENAVKHGLVRVANQYPWCSAAWFERTATPAQVKTIYRFKIDKLNVYDDYDVAMEW